VAFLCCFLLCLAVGFAVDCAPVLNGKNYDFSPLKSSEDYFIGRSVTKLGWDFIINICNEVIEPACVRNVGVCQVWNYNCFFTGCGSASLGSSEDLLFSVSTSGDNILAKFGKGDDGRSSTITFTCDDSAGAGKPTYVAETPINSYQFSWTSAYACPKKGGGGGSGGGLAIDVGWLIIILAIVCFVLYLVIGALIKKFKFGAEGTDIIPNKEFWVDLPSLIKDGFMFLVNKTCRRNSQSF